MQILISHLTGNLNSSAAALAYAELSMLAEFHTTLVVPAWMRWLSVELGWKSGISNRRLFPRSVRPMLRSHPMTELLRLACRSSARLRNSRLGRNHGSLEQAVQRFDAAVARSVAQSQGLQAVHAYMDTAEQTFRAARAQGIRTIYELPTPYWRFTHDIVVVEARSQPEWAMTLPVMDKNSEAMQRRDRELQLADVVLVPSELVRDSLKMAPPFPAQVHVVPYGCPELQTPITRPPSTLASLHPLRVLYVGSLNQGKGLAYLAEAMNGLEELATLTVIGSRTSVAPCAALNRMLLEHRHLSGLSHEEVLTEMRQHDVLVLPTLYEGLALVLLESMACGLTVITTVHSGLAGLIENGQEGFIVPIRDATAIHDRLRQLARDAVLLQTMQQAAQAWSRVHSWQRYREQIRGFITAK
ncbi:glycosyltransferase family 4 protein [Prosthecobacter sp.]|uniref:glycosyltransferase family 4 protein n=1 Tax=Prosthecobacter sp. TaxID=1965333 RepID=UPI0037852800